jgi:glycosyltransferase involved in cell wall biosynthesis
MRVDLNERVFRVDVQAPPPRLSVVTPFRGYDATALLEAMTPAPADVEFILLDDGSANAQLTADVIAAASRLGASARVIVWRSNRGRAAARNRLIAAARGEYVLFLDADMLPDRPTFLLHWLSVTRCQQPDVAFGGLSLRRAVCSPDTALHYDLFGHSDCRAVEERALAPAQSTASSNLLVRRDFLIHHPFDPGFTGWGFEDTDWALRAQERTHILHVDNPATHAGLDTVDTLLRKSAEAGPNFARLAYKHPSAVRRFAAYRAARALKRAPLKPQLRGALAFIARAEKAPMPLRRAAFKLHRAAHFAEHIA